MKIRGLLFAFILSVLFLSEGMATQNLDQTLNGGSGVASLRTIQGLRPLEHGEPGSASTSRARERLPPCSR
jgi:hypothetical protein